MRNIHGYEVGPTPTYGQGPGNSQGPKPGRDALPMAPMMSSAMREDYREPTFYSSLGEAFLLPLRGRGLQWLLMIAFVTLVMMFAMIGARFLLIIGIIIPFLAYAVLLTLNARFFFAAFGATAAHDGEMAPPPIPGTDDSVPMVLPGFILMFWTLTAFIPLIWWVTHVGPQAILSGDSSGAIALILLLFPYFIWPTALVRMTSGSIIDMWNLPSILASIVREPIKYTLVVIFGAVAGLLPMLLAALLGAAKLGPLAGVASLFASCVAMAYCHGVMGAMMGFLAAENPNILPERARGEL